MSPALGELWIEAVQRLNLVVAGITVLTAVSLSAYLFFYHLRSGPARALATVLALLSVVSVGDLFLATAQLGPEHRAAAFWLRWQWLGIAFVAPAYLWFADRIALGLGGRPTARRAAIVAGLALGVASVALVLASPSLVRAPVGSPGLVYLPPGALFPAFAVTYWALSLWAAVELWRSGSRSKLARSRRRIQSLRISLLVPLFAFPWLSLAGPRAAPDPSAFSLLVTVGNLGTALMITVVTYAVAFQGALLPDRAIKRELLKYLIQTVLPGACVLATFQLVPERLQQSLGLPRDLVFMVVTVFGLVGYQILVRLFKPLIDHLIYGALGEEAVWLRRLDERLLTGEDMNQLLEGLLTALCDRMGADAGGVLAINSGRPTLDLWTGSAHARAELLAATAGLDLGPLFEREAFSPVAGFLVRGLRGVGGGVLGLIAVRDTGPARDADAAREAQVLVDEVERALADRAAQHQILESLRALEPEMLELQRMRGRLERGGERVLPLPGPDGSAGDELVGWVRNALVHYWGGPNLSNNPLLRLPVLREALADHEGNAPKAMRQVLDQALERLKPDGERSLTASQWMLYNILELKFVRGLKVRDIAMRLAMSESDLYRKQRVAIEALAGQLVALNRGAGEEMVDEDG